MKILLIEDHAPLREMIADHLVERGFAVDAVAHGENALVAARTVAYDAAILDLGLPDMDGMQVLKLLRSRSGTGLPVLILTARDGIENRVGGLNAGADDYVTKPVNLTELEARLRAVLRRPGPRHHRVYVLGGLSFDTVSREAKVDTVCLDLARREAAVLEELLRVAGHVIAKDVLEDRLYPLHESGSANALEQAVSRLRKKLDSARAGVRIDAKRGIGYRIVESGDT